MNWWAIGSAVGGYIAGFFIDIGKDYFKETLTDRRRERKATAETEKRFSRVRQAMPELIEELQAHFEQHEHAREFVVLPDPTLIYQDGPNSTRFRCYRNRHEHLAEKLARLEEDGHIRDVRPPRSDVPIYRMTEEFIEFVRKV